MDIEGYAVAKVLESLALTDRLVGHIQLRDKEPIWDGFIYVYIDRGTHKKESLKRRVPVQIKGQLATKKNEFSEHIKYSILVNDLKHYLLEGGAVFFIVQINQERMSFQIYMAKLLPYTIKKLLPKSEDTKTVPVDFTIFPEDETKKTNLFLNLINDMEKQKSIASLSPLQTLEELQSLISVNRLILSFTDVAAPQGNPLMYLMENKTFQYAELPNGFTIPIGELPPVEKLSTQAKASVSCGGHVFYESYSSEFTGEKRIISMGKGVHIAYNIIGAPSGTFNLTSRGTLQEIITDASFFCRVLKEKEFFLNETPVKFSSNENGAELASKINDFEKYVNSLKNLQESLAVVGFSQDILVSELSDEDDGKLCKLVASIISQRAVSLAGEPDRSHCFVMNFSRYSIMLLAMRVSENKFRLVNFFSKGVTVEFDNHDEVESLKQAPGALILTTENFMTLDNINYDVIYDEITSFPHIDNLYHGAVNQLLLRMLLAFDRKPNDTLLSCTIKIAEWLCSLSEYGNDAIDSLNYLQAIRRERELSVEETSKLAEIIRINQLDYAIITGAYIVLHDFACARENFEHLSEKEQNNFAKWPIMNLWRPFGTKASTGEYFMNEI